MVMLDGQFRHMLHMSDPQDCLLDNQHMDLLILAIRRRIVHPLTLHVCHDSGDIILEGVQKHMAELHEMTKEEGIILRKLEKVVNEYMIPFDQEDCGPQMTRWRYLKNFNKPICDTQELVDGTSCPCCWKECAMPLVHTVFADPNNVINRIKLSETYSLKYKGYANDTMCYLNLLLETNIISPNVFKYSSYIQA